MCHAIDHDANHHLLIYDVLGREVRETATARLAHFVDLTGNKHDES